MPFSPGDFDIVAQVETTALDTLADVILKQLERSNKTRFTQQIGSVFSIDVELVDIRIPNVRTLNFAERFKRGNTLTSFEVEAELTFSLLGSSLRDTLAVRLKDLQIALFTTPGGLPVGVALGFQKIDIDVTGFGFLGLLVNALVDFVALGIRTALSPLGLVPIPILQFADAFTQLGLIFDRSTSSSTADGSPFIGVAQTQTGLFVAADFEAANNSAGSIAAVQDILTPAMNVGLVVNQRLLNQLLATVLLTDRFGLVRSIASGGINFGVTNLAIRFDAPSRRARVGLDASASARVRSSKGGFFGSLFGSRKVTIRVAASIDLDAEITDDPQTQLAIVAFDFVVRGQGSVPVNSVLASVLVVLLGPFFLIFLTTLSQLLNFGFDVFLPETFKFDVQGSTLTIRLDKITTQLGLGASIGLGGLSGATLKARVEATGGGSFELEHFTVHKFASSGVPVAVDYLPESLESRSNELFLGAGLRTI